MSITVMKQALEALGVEQTVYLRTHLPVPEYLTKAITSLRQAIAEAEKQKPVAWLYPATDVIVRDFRINPKDVVCLPLYTHPQPKREQLIDEIKKLKELVVFWQYDKDCPAKVGAELLKMIAAHDTTHYVAVYTHPQPKREWVGLTDEERETILKKSSTYTWKAIELVEAKLKEKNT